MTTTNEKTFPNLRRFNLFMGLFHLAQGVLMLERTDGDVDEEPLPRREDNRNGPQDP